ncbi:MAG TPA: hypothetical protein GXZ48_07215 [Acholeplasmataceae bacterium]|nr:hypothetical protein [Acholeplasmataceae bacterium]
MKIKRFYLCLVLLLLFGLFGCYNTKNNYKIENVEEALESFRSYSKFDMTYTLNISTLDITIMNNMKVDYSGIKPKAIKNIRYGNYTSTTYYVNGYECYASGDIYNVSPKEFDMFEDVPFPTFDFDEMEYHLSAKKTTDKIIYTVKVTGMDLKTIIEDIFYQSTGNMDVVEIELEVVAFKEKDNLDEFTISFTLTEDGESADVEMVCKFNAVDENVEVTIPSDLYDQIEQYSNPNNEP